VEEARGDAGLRALLVLAAAGLLIAGCGGDDGASTATSSGPLSKAEYEKSFKGLVAQFEGGPKLSLPPNATPQQQGEVIAKGLARFRGLAAGLAKLDPPAEIRHAHEQFVEGLREVADQGQKSVDALEAGNEPKAGRLVSQFATRATIRKITAARREFVRKGYDLGEVSPTP
jgi:hypothetical protein